MWGREKAVACRAAPMTTKRSPRRMQPLLPRGMPIKKTQADMTVAASTYDDATMGMAYSLVGFCDQVLVQYAQR
jgi:hypothetical protein